MRADELRDFLKNFELSNAKIADFFKGKKMAKRDNNIFLVESDLEENVKFKDTLLFIKLQKFLPSTYLLNYLKDNTKDILEIKTERSALSFTYGRPLKFVEVNANFKLQGGKKYYIVTYNNRPLGYVNLDKNKLWNRMNIGDYLREQ